MRIAFCLLLFWSGPGRANDWPQFLGPFRNGESKKSIASSWDREEPKVLWKKKVGEGFAAPIVFRDTLIVFHRHADSEILLALNPETGGVKWESPSPTAYRDDFGFDAGPRATPCIDNGRVFAMGAEGLIRCTDLATGKTIWSVAAKSEFKTPKGFFGMACSPIVLNGNVLLNIGGADGAGIVALNAETGKLRWKATSHEASYSAPVAGNFNAKERVVFFTREAVVLLDPQNGKALAEAHWRARMHASVNAATPLIVSNMIFATTSYGTGAILLHWKNDTLEKVWSGDESLSSHYATPVHHKGNIYGFHGRQEESPSFRCIELVSGRVIWNQENFGAGSVTLAGEQLLILMESGELLLARASPAGFHVAGRTHILGSGTRAYPALSNNRLFARDKNSLVCLALP
jgi:outer membrane protein assembly factor BamB